MEKLLKWVSTASEYKRLFPLLIHTSTYSSDVNGLALLTRFDAVKRILFIYRWSAENNPKIFITKSYMLTLQETAKTYKIQLTVALEVISVLRCIASEERELFSGTPRALIG